MANAKRDGNFVTTLLAVSSVDGVTPVVVYADPVTHRLLTDLSGGGSGTVTSVSVATANGFAGSVADPTTTPEITLETTVTGILQGDGTAISAIVVGSGLDFTAGTLTATAGGGNVSNTGTPVNNQVAIWTDATTIEGDAGLTFSGTTLSLASNGVLASTSRWQLSAGGATGQFVFSNAGATKGVSMDVDDTDGTAFFKTSGNADLATVQSSVFKSTSLTVSEIVITDANKKLVSASVATYPSLTELAYVKGVTSGIQTQLNAKQATITFGTGVLTALGINIGSAGAPVLFDGALGTPSSGTVTNLTGTASININGTVGATTPTTGVFTTLVAGSTTSLLLGTAGSAVGNIGFRNATSGTITVAPPTGALGTVTLTLPAATDTLVARDTTDTLTNKTLTSPTLTTPSAFTTGGTITLAENTSIALDPAGSADGKYTGITVTATAGYTQAFGDLVYLDPTDSRWEAADANAASGADGDSRGILGMVVVAGTDGNACTILLNGIIRADAKFPSFTINNPIYVSETAGSVTQTQVTTTDAVIRVVGAAITSDEMYFNPDFFYITHV